MPKNLYEAPLDGPWSVLCGGGTDNDGSMEDCMKVAPLAGGGYAIADTKTQGAGRELRFTEAELIAFAEQFRGGQTV